MPGIEKEVITPGFMLQSSSQRLAVDFNKLNWSEIISGGGGLSQN